MITDAQLQKRREYFGWTKAPAPCGRATPRVLASGYVRDKRNGELFHTIKGAEWQEDSWILRGQDVSQDDVEDFDGFCDWIIEAHNTERETFERMDNAERLLEQVCQLLPAELQDGETATAIRAHLKARRGPGADD